MNNEIKQFKSRSPGKIKLKVMKKDSGEIIPKFNISENDT
jgi:hypothetical protein